MLEDWAWAHVPMSVWPHKAPLSALVMEATIACAHVPGIVAAVEIDRPWAVIRRGEEPADPETFSIRGGIGERGRRMVDGMVAAGSDPDAEPVGEAAPALTMAPARTPEADEFRRRLRASHPPFLTAVLADARATSANRGRPLTDASKRQVARVALQLAWESDAFAAQAMYRAKARLQGLGVPILPRILHRLAIMTSQLYIGDPVLIKPGVHLAHGSIVIDGMVVVGAGATIFPFVTIGLRAGDFSGPTIGPGVTIGSGAKVIGPVTVGARATVGANAVVVDDVPEGATVVGAPARAVA